MNTKISSFATKTVNTVPTVKSFEELVDKIMVEESIDSILMQCNMDLVQLRDSAEKLFIFDIKIFPSKTTSGWLFKIERG